MFLSKYNSNSNTNDNLLELPELPKKKYPSKIDIKQALSRPFNLTKHNINNFSKKWFHKVKERFNNGFSSSFTF